jgi:hypothetical protein
MYVATVLEMFVACSNVFDRCLWFVAAGVLIPMTIETGLATCF